MIIQRQKGWHFSREVKGCYVTIFLKQTTIVKSPGYLFWKFTYTVLSEPGFAESDNCHGNSRFFGDQLTLSQPGGTDYAHYWPPKFSDLPTDLLFIPHLGGQRSNQVQKLENSYSSTSTVEINQGGQIMLTTDPPKFSDLPRVLLFILHLGGQRSDQVTLSQPGVKDYAHYWPPKFLDLPTDLLFIPHLGGQRSDQVQKLENSYSSTSTVAVQDSLEIS